MIGEMIIKATERGFGIGMDFDNVSTIDKYELLHSVATGLQMSRGEMRMFCHLELSGVMRDAESVTHYEDDAQLERMLYGEGPGAQGKTEAKSEQAHLVQALQKMASGLSVMLSKMEGQK